MQSHLVEEALKVITNPQILVNVISRRVRQLTQGHRPLIVVDSARMGSSDIALTEVIQGKLSYELVSPTAPQTAAPAIIEVPAFTPVPAVAA
jgi:DNA-directed RNA polymerase subunit omega